MSFGTVSFGTTPFGTAEAPSGGDGVSASIVLTTDACTFVGSASAPAQTSFATTTAGATAAFSASSISDPYIVTEPLKNNTGTVLAYETGITAYIYNVSTGALVLTKTGQTTNASGVMNISDASLADATEYRVVVVMTGGAEGMARYTTQ